MILVPFETSDWGFGQDKFNFLKKILCVCIRLVYHLYVSCLHALGMPQRKKKKKPKKPLGNYINFLPMKDALEHYLKLE